MMKHRRLKSNGGFTFVEMLVVIALITLVMFLIYRLFFDSLQVISRGVALSDIHISARTLGETIENDGKTMVGPNDTPPGFLVILQHDISAKRFAEDPANDDIRSDQLLFFRERAGSTVPDINSMVPSSQTNIVPAELASTYARIWYGHAQKTAQDGLDDAALGAPGANEFAANWTLARQALFLNAGTGVTPYAATALPNADIVGYSAGNGYPTALAAQVGTIKLYHGVADATTQQLSSAVAPLGIIETVTAAGYPAGAYPYAYAANRLRVNDKPLWNGGAANSQYAYASWQIAQMHPVFIPFVSDIEVDFAGDYDGGASGIDLDPNGNVKWYSHYYNNPTEGSLALSGPGNQDDEVPYTYSIPTTVAGAPFSRTTAPLTDPHYDTATNPANSTAAIVFQHNDTNHWPYLIRVRARVHDRNGNFESTDRNITTGDASTPGVWYESIIQVNR